MIDTSYKQHTEKPINAIAMDLALAFFPSQAPTINVEIEMGARGSTHRNKADHVKAYRVSDVGASHALGFSRETSHSSDDTESMYSE